MDPDDFFLIYQPRTKPESMDDEEFLSRESEATVNFLQGRPYLTWLGNWPDLDEKSMIVWLEETFKNGKPMQNLYAYDDKDPARPLDTPLHCAAREGNVVVTKWLVSKFPVEPWWYLENKLGQIPEDLARANGHIELADWLHTVAIDAEYGHFYRPVEGFMNTHPTDNVAEDANAEFLKSRCTYEYVDLDKMERTKWVLRERKDLLKARGKYKDLDEHGWGVETMPILSPTLTEARKRGEVVMRTLRGDLVMMEWEESVLRETASLLTGGKTGLRILNIGFGCGIIDGFFQEYKPSLHVIIEAHPDALKKFKEDGWGDKPNVHMLKGTWQDLLLPRDPEDETPEQRAAKAQMSDICMKFDVIFFDTFQEGYRAQRSFYELVPSLLRTPLSKFSFWFGVLQQSRSRCMREVYAKVIALHLRDLGLRVEWTHVPIDTERRAKYFYYGFPEWDTFKKVPICEVVPTPYRRFVPRPKAEMETTR